MIDDGRRGKLQAPRDLQKSHTGSLPTLRYLRSRVMVATEKCARLALTMRRRRRRRKPVFLRLIMILLSRNLQIVFPFWRLLSQMRNAGRLGESQVSHARFCSRRAVCAPPV